jgi:hypothetical protein
MQGTLHQKLSYYFEQGTRSSMHLTVCWDFVFYGGKRGSDVHGGAFWHIGRIDAFGVGLFGALAER